MQKELSQKKQFPGEKIWKAHLQAWRKSGLSGMGYCRQQNLSYYPAHTRRKRGRKALPENLLRVEVVHDLAEEEKTCSCGC